VDICNEMNKLLNDKLMLFKQSIRRYNSMSEKRLQEALFNGTVQQMVQNGEVMM
jgi:hypothetical protein